MVAKNRDHRHNCHRRLCVGLYPYPLWSNANNRRSECTQTSAGTAIDSPSVASHGQRHVSRGDQRWRQLCSAELSSSVAATATGCLPERQKQFADCFVSGVLCLFW